MVDFRAILPLIENSGHAEDGRRLHCEHILIVFRERKAGCVTGKAAPTILKEATRDVLKMRRWLREHEICMAEGAYGAGNAFLRRIEGALKIMGSY